MTKAISKRKQLGEDSRQRILDAASEIAGARGYEGTSINLISQRAGLPASSIYWHFINKDELLAAIIERSFARWFDQFDWPARDPRKACERQLAEILRVNARAFVTSLDCLRLGLMLTLETRPDEPRARSLFLDVRRQTHERIVAGYQRFFGPELEAARAATLARLTIALGDGLFIALRAEPEFDIEAQFEVMAAAVVGAARRLGVEGTA